MIVRTDVDGFLGMSCDECGLKVVVCRPGMYNLEEGDVMTHLTDSGEVVAVARRPGETSEAAVGRLSSYPVMTNRPLCPSCTAAFVMET